MTEHPLQQPRVFYRCYNNGVTAIVTAKVYEAIEAWRSRRLQGTENEPYPGPIFTFVDTDRFSDDPGHTGTMDDLQTLTAGAQNVFPGDFFVPLSNQEARLRDHLEALEILAGRPSLIDAMEAFGLIKIGANSITVDHEHIRLNGDVWGTTPRLAAVA